MKLLGKAFHSQLQSRQLGMKLRIALKSGNTRAKELRYKLSDDPVRVVVPFCLSN